LWTNSGIVVISDNKQVEPVTYIIKVCFILFRERNMIKIWNNGKGIPVVEHKTEKMYVPTLIFGHLLTSSNYDDTEKKVTGKYCLLLHIICEQLILLCGFCLMIFVLFASKIHHLTV
jgi:hypothetical protein